MLWHTRWTMVDGIIFTFLFTDTHTIAMVPFSAKVTFNHESKVVWFSAKAVDGICRCIGSGGWLFLIVWLGRKRLHKGGGFLALRAPIGRVENAREHQRREFSFFFLSGIFHGCLYLFTLSVYVLKRIAIFGSQGSQIDSAAVVFLDSSLSGY